MALWSPHNPCDHRFQLFGEAPGVVGFLAGGLAQGF